MTVSGVVVSGTFETWSGLCTFEIGASVLPPCRPPIAKLTCFVGKFPSFDIAYSAAEVEVLLRRVMSLL